MPYCCVPLCKARASARLRKEKGITFHKFPNRDSDGERHQKWIVNISQEAIHVTKNTTICSKHFLPEMFDKTGQTTRLKEYALPTLFECPNHPVKHFPVKPSDEVKPSPNNDTQHRHKLEHTYCIADSPRKLKQKLEGQIEDLKRKLKMSQTRLSKYKLQVKSMKVTIKNMKKNMFTVTRNF